MKERYYRFLIMLKKCFGSRVFLIFAQAVSAGFFLFFPSRLAVSVRFYQALFPERSRLCHIWCAWRQYLNFTHVFLDRLLPDDSAGEVFYSSEGWEHLEYALRNKTGGIILMSHMGNWEIAAHLMKQRMKGAGLLLYMGTKHKEQIERIQKESLSRSGIRIIAADRNGSSPFDIIEGISFLRAGGLVSLTGDRIWNEQQRTIPVRFLDHEVCLPEMPHIFALLSGAPVFIFFSFRTGDRQYRFSITDPIYVKAASRSERKNAIRGSARKYAETLEQMLRLHPLEWYHFQPFLGRKLKQVRTSEVREDSA